MNEKKFEMAPATIHERIQKIKKFDLSEQLIHAKVNVIKKVVVKFFNTVIEDFRKYALIVLTSIHFN